MTTGKLAWVRLLVAAAMVVALLGGDADRALAGPGSGDEVGEKQPDKKSLVRKWRFSKARRAQLRRIRELEAKIKLLRTAVPKLQQAAMSEADYQRRWSQGYQRRRGRFLSKWRKVVRMLGKAPSTLHTDVYGRFGMTKIWTSDTTDWRKANRRKNQADGDDFYMYANFTVPKLLLKKKYYAIDWSIDGYDFNGRLQTLYRHFARKRNYKRFKFQRTTFRRRITGVGLTPGWYYVRGTLRLYSPRWLQRDFYSAVYISRVNPAISAPPPRYYKYKRPQAVKITKLYVRSRGAPKGQINPKNVYIRGRYEVGKQYAGPDSQLLVGASLYSLGRDTRISWRHKPIRVAYRYRKKLKRTRGRFGSPDTTRIKNLDEGLRPGNYMLRIWILVSNARWRCYWAYEDRPFTVAPLKRLPRGSRR